LRHHPAIAAAFLLVACGDSSSAPDGLSFPPGDPDGGAVAGSLTTNLASTSGGVLYVGAFEPDGGALIAAIALGEQPFPVRYQIDRVAAGSRIIRALLDFPPYSEQPFVDPAGLEDATGVYLNPNSILPVSVRPGTVTARVDFFVIRGP
jgi:hypothetical protein